jgi:hypothetical protein
VGGCRKQGMGILCLRIGHAASQIEYTEPRPNGRDLNCKSPSFEFEIFHAVADYAGAPSISTRVFDRGMQRGSYEDARYERSRSGGRSTESQSLAEAESALLGNMAADFSRRREPSQAVTVGDRRRRKRVLI